MKRIPRTLLATVLVTLMFLWLTSCREDVAAELASRQAAQDDAERLIKNINELGPTCLELASCLGVRGEIQGSYREAQFTCVLYTDKAVDKFNLTGTVEMYNSAGKKVKVTADSATDYYGLYQTPAEHSYKNHLSINFNELTVAYRVCHYRNDLQERDWK